MTTTEPPQVSPKEKLTQGIVFFLIIFQELKKK